MLGVLSATPSGTEVTSSTVLGICFVDLFLPVTETFLRGLSRINTQQTNSGVFIPEESRGVIRTPAWRFPPLARHSRQKAASSVDLTGHLRAQEHFGLTPGAISICNSPLMVRLCCYSSHKHIAVALVTRGFIC